MFLFLSHIGRATLKKKIIKISKNRVNIPPFFARTVASTATQWHGVHGLPFIQTDHPLGRFRRVWRSVRCYHLEIPLLLMLLLLLLMMMMMMRWWRGLDRQQHFICLHSLTPDRRHSCFCCYCCCSVHCSPDQHTHTHTHTHTPPHVLLK